MTTKNKEKTDARTLQALFPGTSYATCLNLVRQHGYDKAHEILSGRSN